MGWLVQETGDERAALWWTQRAVDLAAASGDQALADYALVRRALVTLHRVRNAEQWSNLTHRQVRSPVGRDKQDAILERELPGPPTLELGSGFTQHGGHQLPETARAQPGEGPIQDDPDAVITAVTSGSFHLEPTGMGTGQVRSPKCRSS
ncbi:hypothetical protein GCM10010372_44060 [Streptomyces tauricus]|nr:hypothetical protein GCM10010372_44060 [Streptomyces tauricus]